MGHAGALLSPGENDARRKAKLLQDAGAVLVYHPSQFGEVMAGLLKHEPKMNMPVSRSHDLPLRARRILQKLTFRLCKVFACQTSHALRPDLH